MTKFREVARDLSPILFALLTIVAICIMCLAIVGVWARDASRSEVVQRPDNYEVVEQSSAGVIFTFCSHGARVWAIHSANGTVAVTSQPGHGC